METVGNFTCRPPPLCRDDPRPLLQLPPPLPPRVPLLSRTRWTSAERALSAQVGSRASSKGAFGGQLSARGARRARGGAAQQHLGDRLRWWSEHQAGQRGVPRAGLPGRHNVGTQCKVWRRRGWVNYNEDTVGHQKLYRRKVKGHGVSGPKL